MRRILVIDASVVVDLLGRFAPEPIEEALFGSGSHLVAPELLDIEVLHTLPFRDSHLSPPQLRDSQLSPIPVP